jgi:glycosyltransferase involved in cell wall biosynthesis
LPGIKTVVVNNGVDVERFAGISRRKFTESTGETSVGQGEIYPKHIPTVLTVGGVKARKGTLELVRAMALVHEQIPDVHCIVIGSTDAEPLYTQTVRARIERLGLNDCVHMLGFVPEDVLMDWYANADVFVLPSMNVGWKFEGYGLAHIEASAAGLPVIGTTNCGAEDAIDDGVTGLLVEQARVEELLPSAILRLLTDKTLAAPMGAAGREKARRQTWDHVAAQMLAIYETALK